MERVLLQRIDCRTVTELSAGAVSLGADWPNHVCAVLSSARFFDVIEQNGISKDR